MNRTYIMLDDDGISRVANGEPWIDVVAYYEQYLIDKDNNQFFDLTYELILKKAGEYYLGSNVEEVCKKMLLEKENQNSTINQVISNADNTKEQTRFPTGKEKEEHERT